jgi:hypothetical protein
MYGPPNVSNFNPLTVSYKRADMTGEFYNTAPIDLYVLNTGSKTVELSAGGYIGIGNPTMGTYTVGEPLSISASGDTGKEIYTSTPVFAAVFIDSGVRYPATVNYTYDPVNNRITVTVLYSL